MSDDVDEPEVVEAHDADEVPQPRSNAPIIVTLVLLLLLVLGIGAWMIDPFGWFGSGSNPPPPGTTATSTRTPSGTPSTSPTPTPASTGFEFTAAGLSDTIAAQLLETGTVHCGEGVIIIKEGHNAYCDFVSSSDTSTHYMVTATIVSYTSVNEYTLTVAKAPGPSMALSPVVFSTQLGRAIWDKYGGDAKANCGTELMWIADGLEFQGCTVDGYRTDGTRFAPQVELSFSNVNISRGTYAYAWTVQLVRS
jgi:hypothetical protein